MTQLINIKDNECTGCGICVQVCPHRLISLEKDKAVVDDRECFLCGHCRAVCPTEAVEIDELPNSMHLETFTADVIASDSRRIMSENLIALIEGRRSCRNYKTKKVPESLLRDLVQLGTMAPSGTNCQNWEFVILQEREDVLGLGNLVADYYRGLNNLAARPFLKHFLKMIGKTSLWNYYENYFSSVATALEEWDNDGVDRLFHGATAAIIVSAKKNSSCPQEDALLATQNILLAAEAAGLGSCLIGFAVEAIRRNSCTKKKVGIGDDEEVYSVICLGYPDVKYLRFAGRRTVEPKIIQLRES